MNSGFLQNYGIAAAAAAFFGWRFLSFRRVKKSLPDLLKRGAVVVDVRTPEEFRAGSAPGSVNIPLGELELGLSRLDPAKPVVVCCASGTRSAAAGRILRKHGFKIVGLRPGEWVKTA